MFKTAISFVFLFSLFLLLISGCEDQSLDQSPREIDEERLEEIRKRMDSPSRSRRSGGGGSSGGSSSGGSSGGSSSGGSSGGSSSGGSSGGSSSGGSSGGSSSGGSSGGSSTGIGPAFQTKVNICQRTSRIRQTILRQAGVTNCADITEGDLQNISKLDFMNKKMGALKAGDFDGLSFLEELRLESNNLTSLPDGIFDDLRSLKILYLTDNELTSLPLDIFDELRSLELLVLRWNKLTSLPSGIFDELSSLYILAIAYNKLTNLPDDIFDDLSALVFLDLDGNLFGSDSGRKRGCISNNAFSFGRLIKELDVLLEVEMRSNCFTETEVNSIKAKARQEGFYVRF